MRLSVSVIILRVDLLLQLFEGLELDHAVLESNGVVVFVSQQSHDLMFATAGKGGLVWVWETEVVLVVLCSSTVLSI